MLLSCLLPSVGLPLPAKRSADSVLLLGDFPDLAPAGLSGCITQGVLVLTFHSSQARLLTVP